MRRTALAAIAIGLTVVATGCGGLRGERQFVDGEGNVHEVVEEPVAPVEFDAGQIGQASIAVAPEAAVPTAFAFETQLLDGTTVAGTDVVGARSTIVTFLQPTCPISVEEAPKLAAAASRHPDVDFVLAFSGGDVSDYEAMVTAAGLDLPNVVALDDSGQRLWNRFAVTASPSSLLVDTDLHLRSSYGALGDDGLDRAVALLAAGFDGVTG